MIKSAIQRLLIVTLLSIVAGSSSHAQQYYWSNLAGAPGGSGFLDGTGSAAQFNAPNSVAVDGNGNLYVADRSNHTIRKVTAAGVVTTLAGSPGLSGTADGTGTAARFNNPAGVAVDSGGNVYVADSGNYTIRKVASDGTVTTLAGTPGQSGIADGNGSTALFGYPVGVAVDGGGAVYVADASSNSIRKVTATGVVTTLAGTAGQIGASDGLGIAAQFNQPNGIAVDGDGNVFVADTFNHSVRKITPAGAVTTLAGNPALAGILDGTGTQAMFNFPNSVTLDANGSVYVADTLNHTIRKVTSAGVVTTLAGSAGVTGIADGIGIAAQFNTPGGVAADASGNVYVADSYNHAIRKVTGDWGVVTTFAGSVSQSGTTDGAGNLARFKYPNGVGVDSTGNLFVADSMNNTLRKVSVAAVVSTIAGNSGGLLNGNGTSALYRSPYGVAVTSGSNLFVADTLNHIIRQLAFNGTTWVTTTIGGLVMSGSGFGSTNGGLPGKLDGSGTSAQFANPSGVAADSSGLLYITDTFNQTIRQMVYSGSTWTVSTICGSAELSGTADGAGSAARFSSPFGIAVDSGSNLYVGDYANHTVRKISVSGSTWTVTTLAGSPGLSGTADGMGAAARFNNPAGVAVDSGSNVYVADSGNNTIRRIAPDGTVVTIGGMPGVANYGDGVGGAARFNAPCGVTVDSNGNVLVADSGNNRISSGSLIGTGSASLVSGTGATLNGMASPNGLDTSVYYQYGTTTAYGLVTGTQAIGNGTGFVPVTAGITGLTANSTYHFRLVVVNANGTFYGVDQTLFTPPIVVPTITSAVAVTGTKGIGFTNFQLTADNSATWFGATGLPSGLGLNPATGIISGTAAVSGTFPATIAATNLIGTGTKMLTVSIVNMLLPSFTSGTAATGVVGCGFSYTIVGTPYLTSYSAIGLPPGLNVDPGSGLISGTPTASGTFASTIGAGNVTGISTRALTLTVLPAYQWNNLAGKAATTGTTDGTGIAARFNNPYGLAVDSGSNIYVTDTYNQTIRKVTPAGVVTLFVGSPGLSGTTDGTGTAARFYYPFGGIAMDSGSNIYVADTYNQTIRKISPAGVVTTLAGTLRLSGSANATGTAASFNYPYGLAVDSGSNVYVADSSNNAIRKITPAGVVTTLAGKPGSSGSTDGTGSAALFNSPKGLTVDAAKNVYVSDSGNHTIRKITSAGVVTTLAGAAGSSGSTDGVGNLARFNGPNGIAIDSGSTLYVADVYNSAIRRVSISGSTGTPITIGGTPGVTGSSNGTGSAGRFYNPNGIAVDSGGNLYVADTINYRISIGTAPWPPTITSSLVASGTAGIAFSYAILASNTPGSYQATGLPAGLSVNTATGLVSGTPTVSGSFFPGLSATNLGGTDNKSLALVLRNSVAGWKNLKFTAAELSDPSISGDMASPAGDGIPNLMKYALNLNPKVFSVTGLPGPGTAIASGTNYLVLTYIPAPLVSDITLTVEVTGDMQTWNSGPGYTLLLNTGTASSVSVQDTTPMNNASKRFIRLKVTKP